MSFFNLTLFALLNSLSVAVMASFPPLEVLDHLPDDPEKAAAEVEYRLENAGYPLAVVQVDKSGHLVIFQGRVASIEVSGFSPLASEHINDLLEPLLFSPLTGALLEERLALINDLHGVKAGFAFSRLNHAGDYQLAVTGSETSSSGVAVIDTLPDHQWAGMRATLHQEFYSVLDGGDILRFDLSGMKDDEKDSVVGSTINYQIEWGVNGSFAEVEWGAGVSNTSERLMISPSAQVSSQHINLILGRDLLRSLDQSIVAYGELMHSQDDVKGLGDIGVSVARGHFFQRKDSITGDAQTFSMTFSAGHTDHYDSHLSGDFAHIRVGAGKIYAMPSLSNTAQLRVQALTQWGSQDLPDLELFTLGGSDHLRGFVGGYASGETGGSLTFELADTWEPAGSIPGKLFSFVDVGTILNRDESRRVVSGRPDQASFASIGAGIEVNLNQRVSLKSWVGQPLIDDLGDEDNPVFYLQLQSAW